jgi:hypothetical protein
MSKKTKSVPTFSLFSARSHSGQHGPVVGAVAERHEFDGVRRIAAVKDGDLVGAPGVHAP